MAKDNGGSGVRTNGGRPGAESGAAMPGSTPENIPDKLYFRIGEVAALCSVPTYVLRFWQTEFVQLRPGKSGTGQRLYRKRDVEVALRIKRLLHEQGYTIAGAKAVLAAVPPSGHLPPEPSPPPGEPQEGARARIDLVRSGLLELLALLEPRLPGAAPAEDAKGETE